MRRSNYDKFPSVAIRGFDNQCWSGWDSIAAELVERARGNILVVDCYTGVLDDEILPALEKRLKPALVIRSADAMLAPGQIDALVERDVTRDPVFGHLTQLRLEDFFDEQKLAELRLQIDRNAANRPILVYGVGAALIHPGDILVYADLVRWEAQMRFRRNAISNLGAENRSLKWSLQYKRAFFVDWRVCDRHKAQLMNRWDYVLDTNVPDAPKMATGEAIRAGLAQTARRPFRVVPFFDPAPWGGQWMKEVCDLDRSADNFGWCFDCVPEENSLLLEFGNTRLELPSINVVLNHPRELLGEAVHGRFGAEFPIRFDFLDTMGGGNLSLQVHPLTEYIQQNFGMHYTQDESYYILDAGEDACVYLGVRDNVDQAAMINALRRAQSGGESFNADRFVNKWRARKHDHFLIPAGTVHCSGKSSMVLEISATPYIFTFKMWDWGRLGLDGIPRPIHLNHAIPNIQWDRDTRWTPGNLINRVTEVASGEGWREERTGLHEREFIETRRHWFTKPVLHNTRGGVNVLNLIEGDEAIVESPTHAFESMVVHYAETFIVPACVGAYSIRNATNQACATIKAFVRT